MGKFCQRFVALMLCTGAAIPQMSFAQENSAQPHVGIEDIIVTARRTSESIQDTPIAISAFSSDFIEQQNVTQIDKIAQFVPNLTITTQVAGLSAAAVLIRGVGTGDPSSVADPGVGMYLDGVYIARQAGGMLDLVELERIEVLRGPQGTLFGRNTIGGAVQLVSRKPTDDAAFVQKFSYGSFNSWFSKSTFDTGYIAGTPFKATVSLQHRESDGWVDNKLTDVDPYGIKSDAIWVRLHGALADNLTVDYSFDWNKRKGAPPYVQMVVASDRISQYYGRSEALGGDPFLVNKTRQRSGLQEGYADRFGKYRWDSRSKTSGHAFTVEYQASDAVTLKSITAYRQMDQDMIAGTSGNGDLLGVVFDPTSPTLTSVQRVTPYQSNNAPMKQHQWSQELQLVGSSGEFSYLLGGYGFYEKASEFNRQSVTIVTPVAGLPLLGFPAETAGYISELNPTLDLIGINSNPPGHYGGTAKSYALFGQLSWKPASLDERLEVTGGLRHTWDNKTLWRDNLGNYVRSYEGEADYKNLSWLGSIAYKAADHINVYGRVSSGYKSGGFNASSETLNRFDPEKVISYEMGLKADWLDRRLRTNIALYQTSYDDKQITQFASGSGGAASVVLNAGKARMRGVELDVTAVPIEGMSLTGSLGYTDPKYQEFIFRDPITNIVSNVAKEARFGNVPKLNWNLGAHYVFPATSFGELSAQINYAYRSKMYFFALDRSNIYNEDIASPGQGLLSARLMLSKIAVGDTSSLDIALWGENLTDVDSIAYGIDFGGLGFGSASFTRPRSVGVDVKFAF